MSGPGNHRRSCPVPIGGLPGMQLLSFENLIADAALKRMRRQGIRKQVTDLRLHAAGRSL